MITFQERAHRAKPLVVIIILHFTLSILHFTICIKESNHNSTFYIIHFTFSFIIFFSYICTHENKYPHKPEVRGFARVAQDIA